MAARLPRIAVIALVVALGGGGLTFAATQTLEPASTPASTTPLVQKRAVLTVPQVTGQAFVFAKGALQDAGFAWRVEGGVRGYPANQVDAQSIPAGTRILDNGAPLVTLKLVRNKKYSQKGTPEDISPYHATTAVFADAAGQPLTPVPTPSASTKSAAAAPAATAPAATTPAATTPAPTTTSSYGEAAPAATTPAVTTPAATTPAATTPAPAAPAPKQAAAAKYPQNRPTAFSVAGAPKEPLDEMPLVDRAHLLGRWVASHPKPTDAAVKHWLYQNEWIVTGARFGWWRGTDALQALIQVDRRTVAAWGIGSKSEAVAEAALREVQARSH